MKALLLQEKLQSPPRDRYQLIPSLDRPADLDKMQFDQLFFQKDRMFRHNILRVNYTTYDVHRKQDTINPMTPHRDIIVMADEESSKRHPFMYARVLGIYHVNVTYIGPGMVDHRPVRLEFLWVRWFELQEEGDWSRSKLDKVFFPPMANDSSFGFIDPEDVIRGCHIIPCFSEGRCYADATGLSQCAGDSDDWSSYYVNR